MNLAEELPNQRLVVTFIVKIEDVTAKILEGVLQSCPTKQKNKKNSGKYFCSKQKALPKEKLGKKIKSELFTMAINTYGL
jgi:hypothetical protein